MYIPIIEQHFIENRRKLVKKMGFRAGTPEDAEDVVQEAYARAIKYQKSFDGTNIDRWFHTILNNVLKEFKNTQKGYSTVEYEEEEDQAVEYIYPTRVMAEIYEMIDKRPVVQKEILTLFFTQEYSAKDISNILPSSYSQIHQVIQRFRNELKEIYRE
jgi:RNA polymerase sigma factor (sigma-70 family)